CRKSGLESKRRCGWLGLKEAADTAPVWARKRVSLTTCPKSYISADSLAFLEEYFVWRRLGGIGVAELTAREADAFAVLDDAFSKEMKDGRQDSRHAF